MGSSCSNEKYRFKGFVVSVYPDDIKGGPDEDALGKLNSYVASNPERIPRVCRKINKIMQIHLQHRKVERVMVSVKMLRSLIEHAKSVNGFVPHCIDICAQLLATGEMRYKVGAADVLCILCSRLSQDPKSEPSRRLIADSKDRLLPPLRAMCSISHSGKEGTGMTVAAVVQSRYAAVVAIGQLAWCLNGALAGNVTELFFPVVNNLLIVLKSRAGKPVEDGATIESSLFSSNSSASLSSSAPAKPLVAVPTSAELPKDERDPDLAYARTCVFAVGATAGCVTAASVEPLTQSLIAFLCEKNGWSVPSVPVVIFKALVGAMQERPQGLGFTVFQCLCAAGNANADPVVRIGILRALDACVVILPMSGGRPLFILDYLRAAILAAPVDVKDANTKPTLNAIVSVTASLLRSIYAQRNAPQLQSVLAMLVRLLSDCTTSAVEPNEAPSDASDDETEDEGREARAPLAESTSRTYLALRCMAVASAYVRTTPLIDRQNGALDVCNVIEPFLNGSNDAHRTWAARILRGVLAGMPDGDESAAVLSTDEYDVAFAEAWVKAVVVSTATITPRCVVEVGSVLTAVMAGYGVNAMPFVLTTMWSLQNRCVRGSSGSVAHDANSSNVVTSRTPTSPLTRAWLHLVPVVLASCGTVYEIPKLVEYAQDILSRRQAVKPPELATCFEPALQESGMTSLRFTACGLAVSSANGGKKDALLSIEPTLPPVTKLPSFSYVANIIVDADRPDVVAVFGATAVNDLKTSIEQVCFSAESEANVTLDHSGILSLTGGNRPSELRDGIVNFTLSANPQQLQAARQMRVCLVDRATPGLRGGDTSPAAETSAAGTADSPFAALTASSNAGRIREVLGRLSVDATTSLLPPGTAVVDSLPLFTVSAEARKSLASRGQSHDRQSQRSLRANRDEIKEKTLARSEREGSSSSSGFPSSDTALQAQATLANIEVQSNGAGALAVALKMQLEAQGGSGDVKTKIGVVDVPAQKPWFSLLPSSQYVDLE